MSLFTNRRTAVIILLAAAATVGVCGRAITAPAPADVPVKWELDFTYTAPPKAIQFLSPGSKQKSTYWYFRYSVTNETGKDQFYVPSFVLYTDTGQLLRAGAGVPTGVFAMVKKTHNEPLLQDTSSITGKLLQGDDNSKYGVAVFADIDPNAGAFDLFVGGLSGETAVITLPKPIEVIVTTAGGKTKKVMKDKVALAKTLKLHYSLPGEATARLISRPQLLKKSWVMR